MFSAFRKLLICCLLGIVLFPSGCGRNYDPVKNPGEGEDAPVMDHVPAPTS